MSFHTHEYLIKRKLLVHDHSVFVKCKIKQKSISTSMENYQGAFPLYTQWPLSSAQMYQAHESATPREYTTAYHTSAVHYPNEQYHYQHNVSRTPVSEVPVYDDSTKPCKDTAKKKTSSSRVQNIKPPYSYISLICMAIANTAEKKATLRDIIKYIESHFPYYRTNKKWHGSIRHNLTINDCFVKLPRRLGNRSCLWTIDPAFGDMFDNGSLRRRRYRFKDGAEGPSKAKLKAVMKQVNQHQKSSPAKSPVEDDITACLLESPSVSPASSPLSEHVPFSECSSSSWASTSGDLDEILQTIDTYDQQQASLNMCSTAGNNSMGFTHSDIISSAYHLSVNM